MTVWRHRVLWRAPSVEAILARRGHVVEGMGDMAQTLVPTNREPALTDKGYAEYRRLFGKWTVRQIARELTKARGEAVPIEAFATIAGAKVAAYIDSLISLGVVERQTRGVRLTRHVDNIGPTLEQYVAGLCFFELQGDALWGVRLKDVRPGGDYDVLASLEPTLLYVEVKSSLEVSDGELRHFLQRGEALAPDMAVLLIDTKAPLVDVLARLFTIMRPLLAGVSGSTWHNWLPDRPFIRPQEGFPGVNFGYFRYYVTNSEPSILTKLQRCLQHFHAQGKTLAQGRPVVDFVNNRLIALPD